MHSCHFNHAIVDLASSLFCFPIVTLKKKSYIFKQHIAYTFIIGITLQNVLEFLHFFFPFSSYALEVFSCMLIYRKRQGACANEFVTSSSFKPTAVYKIYVYTGSVESSNSDKSVTSRWTYPGLPCGYRGNKSRSAHCCSGCSFIRFYPDIRR